MKAVEHHLITFKSFTDLNSKERKPNRYCMIQYLCFLSPHIPVLLAGDKGLTSAWETHVSLLATTAEESETMSTSFLFLFKCITFWPLFKPISSSTVLLSVVYSNVSGDRKFSSVEHSTCACSASLLVPLTSLTCSELPSSQLLLYSWEDFSILFSSLLWSMSGAIKYKMILQRSTTNNFATDKIPTATNCINVKMNGTFPNQSHKISVLIIMQLPLCLWYSFPKK